MKCKFCNTAELPDDAKYCHICGKHQQAKIKRRRRRPQAQGTITKLTGSRQNPYWARLPANYSDGIPVRESLGCFPTYAAAAEALTKAMYLPEQAPKKEKAITLQEIYERFISSHYYAALSKSAQGAHRSAWKHLSQCASVPVSAMNKDTFQAPVNAMHEAGLKRESLCKVRNLCSLLCKEAMGMNLITVNYGQLIQLPKSDTSPVQPFSTQEIKKLWEAADVNDKDAWTVLTLIYTGMRPGELLSAEIETHLHTGGPSWYLQTGSKTKAGRGRIIPIPPVLRPIIEKLRNKRVIGPLIVTEHGGFHRLDNWRPRNFNALMARLGLKGHVPYSCRHTYADMLKRQAVSPELLATIMGHEDYSTTFEHYFSTTEEDVFRLCRAADGLERPV